MALQQDINTAQTGSAINVPKSVSLLLRLLNQTPAATDLDITVLRADIDNCTTKVVSGAESASSSYPQNAFLKAEHHVGINANDLPQLARDYRDHYHDTKDNLKILLRAKNILDNGIEDLLELYEIMINATTCLLCVCPDNSSAWSDRARARLHFMTHNEKEDGAIQTLKEEMIFMNFLFTGHPKKPNAWAYRKWIFRQLTHRCVQNGELHELLSYSKAELNSTTGIAESSPKNYHAWTYRLLVIQQMCAIAIGQSDIQLINSVFVLLEREQTSILPWLKRHVSDHSAANYGSVMLQSFLKFGQRFCEGAVREKMLHNTSSIFDNNLKGGNHRESSDEYRSWALSVVVKEIVQIRDFIFEHKYAGSHEVMWLYRRYCNAILFEVAVSCKTLAKPVATAAVEWIIRDELAHVQEGFRLDSLHKRPSCDDREASYSRQHAISFMAWTVTEMYRKALTVFVSKEDIALLNKIESLLLGVLSGGIDSRKSPFFLLQNVENAV